MVSALMLAPKLTAESARIPHRIKERLPAAGRPDSPKYSSTRALIWAGFLRAGRTSMKRKSWTLKASSRIAHSSSRPVHQARSNRRGGAAAAVALSPSAYRRIFASGASRALDLLYTGSLQGQATLNFSPRISETSAHVGDYR